MTTSPPSWPETATAPLPPTQLAPRNSPTTAIAPAPPPLLPFTATGRRAWKSQRLMPPSAYASSTRPDSAPGCGAMATSADLAPSLSPSLPPIGGVALSWRPPSNETPPPPLPSPLIGCGMSWRLPSNKTPSPPSRCPPPACLVPALALVSPLYLCPLLLRLWTVAAVLQERRWSRTRTTARFLAALQRRTAPRTPRRCPRWVPR
mmetsp:Transcript_23091/g.57182  ORF Transcript_23091/g.57182 Transcript_23091/m.57182 type:complete len:205 (-) Transcript_23091:638-1252(-)